MPKPNLEMIKKELNVSKLETLTQSKYCEIKKIIKNAETLGYVNHYYKNKNAPPVISKMEMNCFNFFLDF